MTGRPLGTSQSWPAWRWAAASGAVGAALWAIGWAVEPASRVLGAWLAAFVFWLGLPLGAVALIMIHDLVGGPWGITLRRPLAAIAATLPIFPLVIIPVLAGLAALYPWARPGASSPSGNAWRKRCKSTWFPKSMRPRSTFHLACRTFSPTSIRFALSSAISSAMRSKPCPRAAA